MTRAGDRLGRGRHAAREIRARLGSEIRDARLAAGISQRDAARAVGMSHTQLGRIERGELAAVSVDQLARACAAVGLRLVARAYPDGDPIRDAGQIALLARFRVILPATATWKTEVPLPIVGDLRSWDAVVRLGGVAFAVEAETRLRDVQALDRRIALKQRDAGVELVILLVAATEANRRALHHARESLRSRFPLDGRAILGAVRAGRSPTASGIALL